MRHTRQREDSFSLYLFAEMVLKVWRKDTGLYAGEIATVFFENLANILSKGNDRNTRAKKNIR